MENRRSRTDLNCCRSFRIHCNLNSKDSPPSCSFSRLRELVPIHTGQRCKMKQEIPGISKFPDKRGAFPSTKISENTGSKSNGTEIVRKFISKISPLEVVLFFWKLGNSGNFMFHLAFLPGMNQPQFL